MNEAIDEPVQALTPDRHASEPAPSSGTEVHRFVFSGSGGEYFRLWVVNLALTIATLGIYSAWAKVRRERYFHGHTSLAGGTFGYHGDPRAILKGRAIAALLFVSYGAVSRTFPVWGGLAGLVLFALLPYLRVKSMAFRLRMTSWRGLRFHFREDFRKAYGAYVGWTTLASLTLGLLLPAALRVRARFLVTHSQYGATPFEFESRLRPYVMVCLAMVGMFLATFLTLILGSFAFRILPQAGTPSPLLQMLPLIVVLLVMVPASGIFVAMLTNATCNGTHIGPHRLHSTLRPGRMAWLQFTNLLGIVCTLGLYAPWARVRLTRYRLTNLTLETRGSLDEFVAAQGSRTGATGEAIGEVFDVDFGI